MANPQNQTLKLPELLVFKPAPLITFIDQQFPGKIKFLRAWESPLPLDQFLTSHTPPVRALLSSGQAPVNTRILQLLPALQLVLTTSAGLNHIDVPACRRRGVAVANAGNVFTIDAADLAVGMLIDLLRKITAADGYVRRGLWPVKGEYPLGSKLGGKRVGIVGLGRIGIEVAKRLKPFGCTIFYSSRRKKPSVSYPFFSDVRELATNCDVLIICCGLTDQTKYMINKEVMLALGKKGILINVGRGAIVDQKQIVQCLVQGEIAGAGLDVFENEPEVPEELFELDNVVLSPHAAVHTLEAYTAIGELVLGNLEAFFTNKPLLSPVTDADE